MFSGELRKYAVHAKIVFFFVILFYSFLKNYSTSASNIIFLPSLFLIIIT